MRRSYAGLVRRLRAVADSPDVELRCLGEFEVAGRSYPIFMLCVGAAGQGKRSVMLAAGIHGDEPAGVEAALQFLETRATDSDLLSRFHFNVFPCNNPCGWERNTRENCTGIDLNRGFAVRRPAPEVEIIMQGLRGRRFDLVFEMHEDIDAPGFYLYEIAENPGHYIAEDIIAAVSAAGYPIHRSRVIEHRRAEGGIIRRSALRFRKTRVPQAIYAYRTCGGHVLTLEPPASVLPLEDRVRIELMGLEVALNRLRAG